MSLYGTWFLVDGSNVTHHGNKKWKDAMNLCTSQNKSLPGIDSEFLLTSPMDRANKSLICLAVYQNSSIMFRPVIKQVTNIDGNTTFQPTNDTLGLPFLCRVKTGKVRSLKNTWFYECNKNCETSMKTMHWNSECFCLHAYYSKFTF